MMYLLLEMHTVGHGSGLVESMPFGRPYRGKTKMNLKVAFMSKFGNLSSHDQSTVNLTSKAI